MAILPVIKYGHPTLRKRAETVQNHELSDAFLEDMIETMAALDGVGLAATQVNVDKRMLVAKDIDHKKLHLLINPEIVAYSEKKEIDIEGCLSLPGLQAEVPRHIKIIVKAQTPQGEAVEITAKGHFARVLQHEIDHLNGILYIDRAEQGSLVWVIENDTNDYSTRDASLPEIQHHYLKQYHAGLQELRFEPVTEIA
ncbi:MAG TPA: peptide deformylase [bacterium]|mgnify:CR=1 FL=1|nr:peptide deformylase [bacterium]HPI74324.1 peptide deformylase [bacterium]